MKSKLSASPLRKSFVYLFLLLLVTLGIGAFLRIDIRLLPEQSLPTYTIRAEAPGLVAELMVEQITKPLEDAVRELGEVEKITSRTESGSTVITIKVKENYASTYEKRLRDKLEEVAKRLPGGEDSARLEREQTGDHELAYYLLHGSDLKMLADLGKYSISEKLSQVPGVSHVVVEDGGIANRVEIVLRPSMLQTYGLTPQDLLGQLPKDTDLEQIGTVGEDADSTGIVWRAQAESLQELGRTLISTSRGYVALSLLADIRDLRGSVEDGGLVYQGKPALGIRIYGQESGQMTAAHEQLLQAIATLNEEGQGRYALTMVEDHVAVLTNAMRDSGYLLLIAAFLSAAFISCRQRSVWAGILFLLAGFFAMLTLLSGAWISGMAINIASLGPMVVCALFYLGAGMILCAGYARAPGRDQATLDQLTWRQLPALLLAFITLVLLFVPLLYTDFVKPSDKPALYEGLPLFGWGILGLLAGYGVILPTLAPTFLRASRPRALPGRRLVYGKLADWLNRHFREWMRHKFLPYGVTLILSLSTVEVLHTFVLTDPFLKTDTNQIDLSLQMVKGSSVNDAIGSAVKAEEKLRQIGEVDDLYTEATEQELVFHIRLKEKYEWRLSRTKLEEELEKTLREVPGTDPFALVVGEDEGSRLEFAVKGPSFHTANEIGNQMLRYLGGLNWRDEDGAEIITDERLGEDDGRLYLHIRPKKEMLARYQIAQDSIKEQVSSYLGEQAGGSLFWNNTSVPLVVRYPKSLLEHADQAKQLLIRTGQGTVRLQDLVDWQIGMAPTVVEREDGLYVVKVSSAISDVSRIDGLYTIIPDRMKEKVTIPEGYVIQTGEDLRKLEEEESEKKDVESRFLAVTLAVLAVLIASLAMRKRITDGIIVLLLLPTAMGAILLGLLIANRPVNIMGVYGAMAASALLVQQALAYLTELRQEQAAHASIDGSVYAAAEKFTPVFAAFAGAVTIAALPLSFGWGSGVDVHASFATALLSGMILTAWAVAVLVPGMHRALELGRARRSGSKTDYALLLRVWRDNYRVKRQDRRLQKQQNKRAKEAALAETDEAQIPRKEPLGKDDFLPL